MQFPATTPVSPEVMVCRTCKRVVSRFLPVNGDGEPIGITQYRHGESQKADHEPRPVSAATLSDWITVCDFCDVQGPVGTVPYVYVCADIVADHKKVTAVHVAHRDYRDQHHAARVRRTEITAGDTHRFGENWAACETCARYLDAADLSGLVFHASEALVRRNSKRRRRIVEIRADLTARFGAVLDTLLPIRGVVSPEHPLGVWQEHNPAG